jgi:hypothetical protein
MITRHFNLTFLLTCLFTIVWVLVTIRPTTIIWLLLGRNHLIYLRTDQMFLHICNDGLVQGKVTVLILHVTDTQR